MVIHIFKANNSSFRGGLMFKLIGMSNVACGSFFLMRGMATKLNMASSVLLILSTAIAISYFLQLGFNLSLAFERYKVAAHAIEYFTSDAKRKLEKKLSRVVLAISLSLGAVCATMRVLLHKVWFLSIPIAISRIVGYLLLCILYAKLYASIKSQNQVFAAGSSEQGMPPIGNKEMSIRRRKQLEHSRKFFIGITSSFFVLNLPTIATFFIIDQFPTCATWQGILVHISSGMFSFNMIFDSLWYFYMYRRSRNL